MTIRSPLVPSATCRLVGTLNPHEIIDSYQQQLQLDVSHYFTGLQSVEIYQCPVSKYKFYYPLSLAGNEELYRHLQQFEWNYKPDKWEYHRAAEVIPNGSRILDVGCGEGAFLRIATRRRCEATGLETNSKAAAKAKTFGSDALVETIEEHLQRGRSYDAVCSFQVLEHIPKPRSFISACLECLRPKGLLIFGVPNNDGFLKYAHAPLNAPPHHMGLWSHESLNAIPAIFPVEVVTVLNEPLQEIEWYTAVLEQRWIKSPVLRSLYHKAGGARIVQRIVSALRQKIAGHTVLAIYRKL